MTRYSVRAGAVALLLAMGVLLIGGFGSPVTADVIGDDQRDVYVGTGGLLLPGSVDDRTRRTVAGCADCQWRLTTPCVDTSPGHAFDSAGPTPCVSVVRGCPGGRLLRSWFSDGGAWRETGLICLTDARPVTVARLGSDVSARLEEALPRLRPSTDPARGLLTQLPVIVAAGQPADEQWTMPLLGRDVVVRARATWTWDFGDGARLTTGDPGAPFPRGAVAHAYRRSGVFAMSCTAQWSATFSVDGLGPFPVPGLLTQRADMPVAVGEGRALLVPGGMAH
jgi:hypothetical protein